MTYWVFYRYSYIPTNNTVTYWVFYSALTVPSFPWVPCHLLCPPDPLPIIYQHLKHAVSTPVGPVQSLYCSNRSCKYYIQDTCGYDPSWVTSRVRFSLPMADIHTSLMGMGIPQIWIQICPAVPQDISMQIPTDALVLCMCTQVLFVTLNSS